MNHRKSMHSTTVAVCKNYSEGMCNYSDEMCWWNHGEKTNDNEEHIKCFICNKIFESKAQMMSHRKLEHSNLITPCNKFRLGNCRFRMEVCWYKHELESEDHNNHNTFANNFDEERESESVFRRAPEVLEPPLLNQQKTKKRKDQN